jgi:hypothetical protein
VTGRVRTRSQPLAVQVTCSLILPQISSHFVIHVSDIRFNAGWNILDYLVASTYSSKKSNVSFLGLKLATSKIPSYSPPMLWLYDYSSHNIPHCQASSATLVRPGRIPQRESALQDITVSVEPWLRLIVRPELTILLQVSGYFYVFNFFPHLPGFVDMFATASFSVNIMCIDRVSALFSWLLNFKGLSRLDTVNR